MYIFLIRHGETNWNKERKVQGRTNISINENGIKQALAVQKMFDNKKFEAMIVSPLIRTLETGKIVTQHSIVDSIVVDERIIEKDFGVTEGMNIDERYSKYPHGHARNEESYKLVRKRMKEAIEDYSKKYKNDILVVTHGSALAALTKELNPSRENDYIIFKNASISVINSETLKFEAIDLAGEEAQNWINSHE